MIASLTGTVESLNVNRVVINVGGIGYLVQVTPVFAASLSVNRQIHLFISHIVREDAALLFGFGDSESRDFFELLQTVSGVGPKVALSMLTSYSSREIEDAVAHDRPQVLEKIPGIGKKVASRLILELKDKVAKPEKSDQWGSQLLAALTGLGYKTKDAEVAIDRVRQSLGKSAQSKDLGELLKLALTSAGE